MVLHDTTLPIAVDEVVQFEDLEPTKIDAMFDAGLVPQWAADASKLYPDLWPTRQAAQKAYQRAGFDLERLYRTPGGLSRWTSPYKDIFIRECPPTPLFRFSPNARGGGAKARHALVDTSKLTIEDARKRLRC